MDGTNALDGTSAKELKPTFTVHSSTSAFLTAILKKLERNLYYVPANEAQYIGTA